MQKDRETEGISVHSTYKQANSAFQSDLFCVVLDLCCPIDRECALGDQIKARHDVYGVGCVSEWEGILRKGKKLGSAEYAKRCSARFAQEALQLVLNFLNGLDWEMGQCQREQGRDRVSC